MVLLSKIAIYTRIMKKSIQLTCVQIFVLLEKTLLSRSTFSSKNGEESFYHISAWLLCCRKVLGLVCEVRLRSYVPFLCHHYTIIVAVVEVTPEWEYTSISLSYKTGRSNIVLGLVEHKQFSCLSAVLLVATVAADAPLPFNGSFNGLTPETLHTEYMLQIVQIRLKTSANNMPKYFDLSGEPRRRYGREEAVWKDNAGLQVYKTFSRQLRPESMMVLENNFIIDILLGSIFTSPE